MNLLTTTQAAELLGVQPQTIRKMVYRGRLKGYKFGGALAFHAADIYRAKDRPGPGRPAKRAA
jgi:excisionase family DNA binding protein